MRGNRIRIITRLDARRWGEGFRPIMEQSMRQTVNFVVTGVVWSQWSHHWIPGAYRNEILAVFETKSAMIWQQECAFPVLQIRDSVSCVNEFSPPSLFNLDLIQIASSFLLLANNAHLICVQGRRQQQKVIYASMKFIWLPVITKGDYWCWDQKLSPISPPGHFIESTFMKAKVTNRNERGWELMQMHM